MTKTRPVIGALKTPPNAPATPQPMRSMRLRCSRRKRRPKLDPTAAPVRTIGDSAPTDPPKPMVSALARSDDQVLCGLMRLLRWEMALSTFVTPCPISSRTMYRTKSSESKTPRAGKSRKK